MKDMKKIYQKLALTCVLAALLLSAGCGGAKETSANETAGDVQAVGQKTESTADAEQTELYTETLEADTGALETNIEAQTQGYTFTDDLVREVTVKSADRASPVIRRCSQREIVM